MGHIFISYSHKDTDYAHKLSNALQSRGFDVWIDERLDYGSQWPREIQKRLDSCSAFIVIMSPRSFVSEWVQSELQRAKRKLKPVFPMLLEGDEPWLSVESTQYYDVRGENLPDEKFFSDINRVVPQRTTEVGSPASKPKKTPSSNRPKLKTEYVVAIIGAVAVILAAFLGSPLIEKWFFPPVATETATATMTSDSGSVTLSETVEPNEPPTETVIQTSTPLPPEITDDKGVTMRLIPAGAFVMGSYVKDALLQCQRYVSECDESWFEDEEPPHNVVLSDYYVDKTEVTNAMYRDCANTGTCQPPRNYKSHTRKEYYGNGQYDGYPVMFITWSMAQAYCEWRGGRLPTEAEWEKAARGTDGRVYPWGNDFIYTAANYCDVNCSSTEPDPYQDDGYADTSPVGHYSQGKSDYGLYDMAGNVWEWVSDFYQENYYITLPDSVLDPPGPSTGIGYVLRGGAANTPIHQLRSSARVGSLETTYADSYVGFRCARDVTP